MMLSKELSDVVLTVGCEYNPPKGGVAQVMYTYSKEVYPVFRCITNSGKGSPVRKLWKFAEGWVKVFSALLCNRAIKIVHIHTASWNSFRRSSYFVNLAKLFHKKVVLHIHGGGFKEYFKTNPEWIRGVLLKADYVMALTDTWTRYYQEALRLPHVVTVNNIISKPQIKAGMKQDGCLHLLFLGAINEQKGIFDLAELICEHKEEWTGRLVLHVGGNQETGRLLQYIQEHGLSTLILYEGWVSGDKKTELLNRSDAFILPSYVEGLPVSILEALSYGKPVISTPVGGIPEVVNEHNGYLFEPGDRGALYAVLKSILDVPSSLHEKAENARRSVEQNFPDEVAAVLERVYAELVK